MAPVFTDRGMLRAKLGDHEVVMAALDARPAKATIDTKDRDLVRYAGITGATDLEYEVEPNAIKETIVLRKPSARGDGMWRFRLTTGALTPAVEGDRVLLKDQGGAVAGFFPPIQVWDSSGGESKAPARIGGAYRVERSEDGWLLTVAVDSAWLADPARVYPVSVDPTLVIGQSSSVTYMHRSPADVFLNDGYVNTGNSQYGGGDSYLRSVVRWNTSALVGKRIAKAWVQGNRISGDSSQKPWVQDIHSVLSDNFGGKGTKLATGTVALTGEITGDALKASLQTLADTGKTEAKVMLAGPELAATYTYKKFNAILNVDLATVPGAPTGVSAAPGDRQATVSWTAPADGGSPITAYAVTTNPAGGTVAISGTTATVTGLTNGVAYTFTVKASNAVGAGPVSSPSLPVTPRTIPATPTGVRVVPGDASATVSWSAPADGGSPITAYTVRADPGDIKVTADGTATSVVVSGLVNGRPYTFTVQASNAAGTSPASAPVAATPAAPPGPPAEVSAVAGDRQVTVSWHAPASDGGSPITGYTVIPSHGQPVPAPATATSAVVPGLTNGTAYTFTVKAANAAGLGVASQESAPVTPVGPPGVPVNVRAASASAKAILVTWEAPASDGGSPITGYTVIPSEGEAVPATQTTVLVTGLEESKTYTFRVNATNRLGTGPASEPSNGVSPGQTARPGPPTNVRAVSGDGKATVTWDAPSETGDSAIVGYTVTSQPDGKTVTVSGTTAVVPGLTNGTPYTFTVVATNGNGDSAPSTPSTAVTPQPVPGAPVDVRAQPGNGKIDLFWGKPDGATVKEYRITVRPGDQTITVAGDKLSAEIPGLTNGIAYRLSIMAANDAGSGPAANPGSPITPSAYARLGTPTIEQVLPRFEAAKVSWVAPVAGEEPVTGYTVTATPLTENRQPVTATVPAATTSTELGGLVNDEPYMVAVTATYSGGNGVPALYPGLVLPVAGAVPQKPVIIASGTRNGSLAVRWGAPADGGAPITGYVVRISGGIPEQRLGATVNTTEFTGLTNGTAYTVSIAATNRNGDGEPVGIDLTPATLRVPGLSRDVAATAETQGKIRVTWTKPADDGGDAIDGYRVKVTPGDQTVDVNTTEAIIADLDPATGYTFSIQAHNSEGYGGAVTTKEPVKAAMKLVGTPIVLNAATLSALNSISGNGVLDFAGVPAQLASVRPGAILVADVHAKTPNGLLRKVTWVEQTGGNLRLATDAGNLSDIFGAAGFSSSQLLSDAAADLAGSAPTGVEVTSLGATHGVTVSRAGAAATADDAPPLDVRYGFGDGKFALTLDMRFGEGKNVLALAVAGEHLKGGAEFGGHLRATFAAGPYLDLDGGLGWGNPWIRAEAGLDTSLEADVDMKAVLKSSFKQEIGRVEKKRRFTIGGVPVVLIVAVELAVEVEAKGAVKMKAKVTQKRRIGVGVRASLRDIDIYQVRDSQGSEPTTMDVDGELKAAISLPIEASVSLFDITEEVGGGFKATLKPQIEFEASTEAPEPGKEADPWWKIEGGLIIELAASFAAFGFEAEKICEDCFELAEWPIAEADGPFRGLRIDPDQAETRHGQPVSFTATRVGLDGSTIGPITWSVEGSGKIDDNGDYTPDQEGPSLIKAEGVAAGRTYEATAAVHVGAVPPGAPRNVRAEPAVHGIAVAWEPPADNGGSPVTRYRVTAGGVTVTVAATERGTVVPGLSPGSDHQVTVYAENRAGQGDGAGPSGSVQVQGLYSAVGAMSRVDVNEWGRPDPHYRNATKVLLSGDGRYAVMAVDPDSTLVPLRYRDWCAPQFAYCLIRKEIDTGRIEPVGLTESGSYTATAHAGAFYGGGISHDGNTVAYLSAAKTITVATVDARKVVQVSSPDLTGYFELAANGSVLFYKAGQDQNSQLHRKDLRTGADTIVATSSTYWLAAGFSVSAQGDRVLLNDQVGTQNGSPCPGLVLLDLVRNTRSVVADGCSTGQVLPSSFLLTADGRQVFAVARRETAPGSGTYRTDLYKAPVDGVITTERAIESWPELEALSPDTFATTANGDTFASPRMYWTGNATGYTDLLVRNLGVGGTTSLGTDYWESPAAKAVVPVEKRPMLTADGSRMLVQRRKELRVQVQPPWPWFRPDLTAGDVLVYRANAVSDEGRRALVRKRIMDYVSNPTFSQRFGTGWRLTEAMADVAAGTCLTMTAKAGLPADTCMSTPIYFPTNKETWKSASNADQAIEKTPAWVRTHYVSDSEKQKVLAPDWFDQLQYQPNPCKDRDRSAESCQSYPFYGTEEGGSWWGPASKLAVISKAESTAEAYDRGAMADACQMVSARYSDGGTPTLTSHGTPYLTIPLIYGESYPESFFVC
ncbi:fibronectin type III domain-containing protein [Nonomuraea sp. NPDC050556]|uniref:fibronectin type III domain-containing protein n=1 Tax=Nonomuraea sp. NPDC050556 TaxID=3364369 RepID=UPI0037A017F4